MPLIYVIVGLSKIERLSLCGVMRRTGAMLVRIKPSPLSVQRAGAHMPTWQPASDDKWITPHTVQKIKSREWGQTFGSPHVWECVFIRGNGMEARLSRELSAHSSAMKLGQIRGVRRAESWMAHHVRLAGFWQTKSLLGKYSALWLMDWMEAGWLVHWSYGWRESWLLVLAWLITRLRV